MAFNELVLVYFMLFYFVVFKDLQYWFQVDICDCIGLRKKMRKDVCAAFSFKYFTLSDIKTFNY